MKNCITLCIVLLCCLQGIGQNTLLRADGKEIRTRIVSPKGYARVNVKEGSFGEYLRNLPLRSHGAKVHYFDGREKWKRSVYCVVVHSRREGKYSYSGMGIHFKDLKRFKD